MFVFDCSFSYGDWHVDGILLILSKYCLSRHLSVAMGILTNTVTFEKPYSDEGICGWRDMLNMTLKNTCTPAVCYIILICYSFKHTYIRNTFYICFYESVFENKNGMFWEMNHH